MRRSEKQKHLREALASERSGTYVEKRKCGKMSFDAFDLIGALVSWRWLMLGNICISRNPSMIEDQGFWRTCLGQSNGQQFGQSHQPVEPDVCNTTNGSLRAEENDFRYG